MLKWYGTGIYILHGRVHLLKTFSTVIKVQHVYLQCMISARYFPNGIFICSVLNYKHFFSICRNCFPAFISSPEPKAHWWAYRIGRHPSSVVRLSSTLFKHLLLRNRLASLSQLNMEPPWDGGTKVCSNDQGDMTKMTVMPIYGKNLKKSSSPEPKGRWPWNLVCSIGCTSTTKFIQMMTLGWSWPILRQG